MSRYSPVDPDQLSPAQREVYESILAGPRGAVQGPFHLLLRSPDLCSRAQALGAFLRFDSALPARLSELAILVTARFWGAQFEWYMHARFAAEGGLSAHIIEAIRTDDDPRPLMAADEKVVYDVAKTVHESHRLDDATYQRATEQLGEAAMVDLIALLGYYTLISMVLNVYEVPVPDGSRPLE